MYVTTSYMYPVKKTLTHSGCGLPAKTMADGVGFEPTDPCESPVFKTGAISLSATHP